VFSVLYVDDEPDLLLIGKLFLEKSGHFQVNTCSSVHEAQEKLASNRYDAIVSDYQMPGMDGLVFLKYLRTHGKKLPFILFTGKGREEVVIEALNCGADLYLQKGGDPKSQFAELEHKIMLVIDRKRSLEKLKESEQRMTEIINHLPDATFAIDLGGNVIAWNLAMEEMTGISKDQILMKGDYEYSLPFYGIRRPMLLNLILKDDEELENQYPCIARKNNRLISENFIPHLFGGKGAYLWFMASPLYDTEGNITGAIESIRDITDRKRAEEEYKKGEDRFRAVIESQTEFICRFLPDGTHVFVNDAYCRYFGKTTEDIIGSKFVPRLFAGEKERVRHHFSHLSIDNPLGIIEHRIIMPGGEVRWQQWCDRAIFDGQGNIIEFQSVGRDITDRKKAEAARLQYEHHLAHIINFLPDATFVIDQKKNVIAWNKAMEEITGVLAEQMLGRGDQEYAIPFYGYKRPLLVDLVLEPDDELEKECYQMIHREGNRLVAETHLAHPKKRPTYLWGVATPLYGENGVKNGAIESIRDITEYKNARKSLQTVNDKLNMLNTITRHDILNQILILRGFLSLSRTLTTDSTLISYLEKGEHVAGVIQNQIEFTRNYQDIGTQAPKWQVLGDVVGSAVKRMNIADISVQSDIDAMEVFADPILEKVFDNLIENTLFHGGHATCITITVETREKQLAIIYRDNGAGIPEDEKKNLFQKGFGKNTGLGLFLSKEILSITGIDIMENGEPGEGVRFEILVPEGNYRSLPTT
jgi:PAS domain S-box-containing protein